MCSRKREEHMPGVCGGIKKSLQGLKHQYERSGLERRQVRKGSDYQEKNFDFTLARASVTVLWQPQFPGGRQPGAPTATVAHHPGRSEVTETHEPEGTLSTKLCLPRNSLSY